MDQITDKKTNALALPPLLQTMRPRQWPKNGFVFAALIFDGTLENLAARLGATVAAFVLLCALSSAVYIMNDLVDIDSDRLHPVKKNRPLPSGRLRPGTATAVGVILAGGSLAGGFALAPLFGALLLIYGAMQIGYSLRLKHVVLLDVLIIAAGFVLRVASGVTVIEVQRFSPWLYVCSGLLALFMALGKRRHELVLLGDGAGHHRQILNEYTLEFLDRMIAIVLASTVVSYAMYTFLAEGLPENHAMMLTIPFVLYGVGRYLYLILVHQEGGAPEEILLKDRPFQVNFVLWGLTVGIVLYLL